ncbi:hypothetical protein [Streptomyces pseudoechinosporeus]
MASFRFSYTPGVLGHSRVLASRPAVDREVSERLALFARRNGDDRLTGIALETCRNGTWVYEKTLWRKGADKPIRVSRDAVEQ